jgi:hypothetical protein
VRVNIFFFTYQPNQPRVLWYPLGSDGAFYSLAAALVLGPCWSQDPNLGEKKKTELENYHRSNSLCTHCGFEIKVGGKLSRRWQISQDNSSWGFRDLQSAWVFCRNLSGTFCTHQGTTAAYSGNRPALVTATVDIPSGCFVPFRLEYKGQCNRCARSHQTKIIIDK